MRAVIPCAKEEQNLFPFIDSRPTGLMPLADSFVVSKMIEKLFAVGIDEVILVVNYRKEMFEEKFEGIDGVVLVEQEEVTGIRDALLSCGEFSEPFVVVNGDVFLSDGNLERLVQRLENDEQTVLADSSDKAEKFGVLSIEGENIKSVIEKPEHPENNLVNTGIYGFKPSFLQILEGSEDMMTALNELFNQDNVKVELVEGEWIDIGSPKKLHDAEVCARRTLEPEISESAQVSESAFISDSAKIDDNAKIGPNTVIMGHSYIGRGAELAPGTVIKDSTVQRNSQVLNSDLRGSAVWEDTIIDPNVSIENSILAEESVVRSGTCISQSFLGPRSHVDMNNSIRGVKFVPDARTDLSEISK